MAKTYTVKFFIKECVDSGINEEYQICCLKSNKYIPLPNVGDIVCLAEANNISYKVIEKIYYYPYSFDEEYEYNINVIVVEVN